MTPKPTPLPLGATVQHDGREATIWGVSFCEPPKYLLKYTDGTKAMCDNVLPGQLVVIDAKLSDDVTRRLAMSNPGGNDDA